MGSIVARYPQCAQELPCLQTMGAEVVVDSKAEAKGEITQESAGTPSQALCLEIAGHPSFVHTLHVFAQFIQITIPGVLGWLFLILFY